MSECKGCSVYGEKLFVALRDITSLRKQLTKAQRELRQYPFTIEYSKHFEEKITPHIERAEKAEAMAKVQAKLKEGEEQENKRLLAIIEDARNAVGYECRDDCSDGRPCANCILKQALKEVE